MSSAVSHFSTIGAVPFQWPCNQCDSQEYKIVKKINVYYISETRKMYKISHEWLCPVENENFICLRIGELLKIGWPSFLQKWLLGFTVSMSARVTLRRYLRQPIIILSVSSHASLQANQAQQHHGHCSSFKYLWQFGQIPKKISSSADGCMKCSRVSW